MSGETGRGSAISPEVQQQAAEWLVELQADSASQDIRGRCQQWRAAHPDHERAWQRIESFGSRLQAIPSPLLRATLAQAASAHVPTRRKAVKTLAVLLFAGGAAWYGREHSPWPQWMADASTGRGELRSLTLADGTRVELSASTRIDIRFSSAERLVRLLGGEILVTTAHASAPDRTEARPFIVETTHGRIRALGTRFTVRQLDRSERSAADASQVSVFEGAVAVRPSHDRRPAADAERVLNAGQQASFTRDAVAQAEPADATSTAWTQGMVVVQDMPLVDFIAELTRYAIGSAADLRCDPAVAELKVSGTYPLADPDKALDMLQMALPIRIRQQRRWWGGTEVVLVAR